MNGHAAVIPNKLATKAIPKTKKAAKKRKFVISQKTWLRMGIFGLVFAVLFSGVLGYSKIYEGKIYPKVVVAGVRVGGMTIDEAKEAVQSKAKELNENGPTITYNQETLTPKLDEMGVTFNIDEVIKESYEFGREGSLSQKIQDNFKIFSQGYQVNISPQIDETKFNDYLGQLARVAEKEPVDATLKITNGQISLVSAQRGLGLDKEKLKSDLQSFINSGQNGQIVMNTSELEPKVTDEETLEARAQAEKYLQAAPLSVQFEDSTWTADRTAIGSWIKFAESNGKLATSLDPTGFVKNIASQVEIAAKDKEVEDGTGTVLNEGQDGRGLDTNTLTSQIKDAVLSGQADASFALITYVIPKGEKTVYPHAQPGRYEGRYIDINLSEQTLYAFEGSNQVNSFLVSTGKRGYATPTGEFHIYGKDRYALMDGPDYYLPNVPYVSWFSGDYSIHGTYWHHNFGHVMSHGCVNASTGDAEWIFGWADIGTPVYIHY